MDIDEVAANQDGIRSYYISKTEEYQVSVCLIYSWTISVSVGSAYKKKYINMDNY